MFCLNYHPVPSFFLASSDGEFFGVVIGLIMLNITGFMKEVNLVQGI